MDYRVFKYRDYEEVYNSLKTLNFTKVSNTDLSKEIILKYQIEDKFRKDIENSVKAFMRKRKTIYSHSQVSESVLETVVCILEDGEESTDDSCELEEHDEAPNYYRSLLEVGPGQQYRRTEHIFFIFTRTGRVE